jgi:hypothetical protein
MVLAPIGVTIPGPIGEFFRLFKAYIMVSAACMLIIAGWLFGSIYYNGACLVTSSPYQCQMAYELNQVPVNMLRVLPGFFHADPKVSARQAAEQAHTQAAGEQAVIDRYNARVHANGR